jgi:alpha-tubulin suppressor-like RCC1 family protein
VQIVSAVDITCARTEDGDILCWGDDAYSSMLMSGDSLPKPTRTKPTPVLGVKHATVIDVGSSLGCAIDESKTLSCWTDRSADQYGPAPLLTATPVDGVRDVTDLSLNLAANADVCARGSDRRVTCLSADHESLPMSAKSRFVVSDVDAYQEGDLVSCAIRNGGDLACWGGTFSGLKQQDEALRGPPLMKNAKGVSAGSAFACAVDAAGKVGCFGADKGMPPAVPAKIVRAGVYHACIVDMNGHVACWGDNRFGQLGLPRGLEPGGGLPPLRAWPVAGVDDAVDVAVGNWHTCALEKTGRVKCWGRNTRGQLGDGTNVDRAAAAEIVLP